MYSTNFYHVFIKSLILLLYCFLSLKMKKILFILLTLSSFTYSQDATPIISKKGSFYFYWGWNRGLYSKSDIHFQGLNYDFTLHDVAAQDKVAKGFRTYVDPATITIPQYNFRIGYFINDKYDISIASDHMKYVMKSYQTVKMDGYINNSGFPEYDGSYYNTSFDINPKFLQFEHTDGLNYLNVELRRNDSLFSKDFFKLRLIEGIGAGILYPRSNTTLMGNARYDQFNVAGFGIGGVVALNLEFWNRFFLQTELKAGFIDMPSIRTTLYKADKASQHFWFLQSNVVLGMNFNYKKKAK